MAATNVEGIGSVDAPSRELKQATEKPANPRSFRIHADPPIPLITQYDVPTAMATLTQHSTGVFYQSGLMADAMRSDDAVSGAFRTRELGLTSKVVDWELGTGKRAKECMTALRDNWEDIVPEDVFGQMMKAGLQMGFAWAQIIWSYKNGLVMPRLQFWHPALSQWSWQDRCFQQRTVDSVEWSVPGTGEWFGWTPYGNYLGWRDGLINSLTSPWLARQYAWRDWGRFNEVHGLPIRKIMVPETASEADKAAFNLVVSTIGTEGNILLPTAVGGDANTGFNVELLEATSESWDGFEAILSKAEGRIAINVLGQNLTTEVSGGSLAAANVHDRIRLDYVRGDARSWQTALYKQLFQPFARFNFGDETAAPTRCWKVTEQEDKLARAQAISSVSQAVAQFKAAAAPVDLEKLLESAGVPLGAPLTPVPAPEAAAPKKPEDGAPEKPEDGKVPAPKATMRLDDVSDADIERAQLAGGFYTWVSSPRSCDECESLDGKRFDSMMKAKMASHPNCKCSLTYTPRSTKKKKTKRKS